MSGGMIQRPLADYQAAKHNEKSLVGNGPNPIIQNRIPNYFFHSKAFQNALLPASTPSLRCNHLGWWHVFRAFLPAAGGYGAVAATPAFAAASGGAWAIFQGSCGKRYRHSAVGVCQSGRDGFCAGTAALACDGGARVIDVGNFRAYLFSVFPTTEGWRGDAGLAFGGGGDEPDSRAGHEQFIPWCIDHRGGYARQSSRSLMAPFPGTIGA